MQKIDGTWHYSATDLNNFLACGHLTTLTRAVAYGERELPQLENEQAEILRRLGDEHERAYLELLRARGTEIVTIARPDRGASPSVAAAATEAAMRSGASIIFQAAFLHDGWFGYADFLRRVERPSALGDFSYEVADTKLARHSEPYFLLQICNYSEHVARIQGLEPARAAIVLGDGREEPFELAEFAAHYRAVKARFLRAVRDVVEPTRPYPVAHCGLCAWKATCDAELAAADALSGVANIRRAQAQRLEREGIATLAQLAGAEPGARPAAMAPGTFDVLRDQARLQAEQRAALAAGDADWQRIRVLPRGDAPAARGFELLPPRDAGDVFFDMEGDPYYSDGSVWFGGETGLEYLFGAHTHDEGFVAFWGCDRGTGTPRHRLAEKRAFEAFVDWLVARRERYPDFFIYHYAAYEQTALKRLAQRHRTREDAVDALLREGRMIDLYRVVRQALRVGQPSYSIKKLEDYYEKRERSGTAKGDDSIVQFEAWLRTRADGAPADGILADIEQYNAFDCTSTAHLLDWLWKFRDAHPEALVHRPNEPVELAESTNDLRDRVAAMRARLFAGLPKDLDPADAAALPAPQRLRWLVAEALAFYDREAKPQWWEVHDACDGFAEDPDEAIERNGAAIGGLRATAEMRGDARLFTFPPQTHKLKPGDRIMDMATRDICGSIAALDNAAGTLALKLKPDADPPAAIIEFPNTFMGNALVEALLRVGAGVLDGTAAGDDPLADVLLRRSPRFRSGSRSSVQPAEPDGESILPLVLDLDRSALFIQGPPGSGKTQTGAELIVALIARGKRVGVTGPSHAAIHNLLDRVALVAHRAGIGFAGIYKMAAGKPYAPAPATPDGFVESKGTVKPSDRYALYAGTPWLFAHRDFAGAIDVLFVDEAGQIELPKFVAMSASARDVVLLGDPAQLSQVSHAAHPGDVGLSVLEYLLDGEQTVPPDRGIFLTTSHRMQRDVCAFVSELSYRGRLHEAPECNLQRVDSPGLSGAGLRAIAVPHEGNRSASPQEADRIAEEVEALLRGTVVDRHGVTRPLRRDDIIVVSPYNAQRLLIEERLRARLGDGIEVGTVNKFQGREAYVVVYSMATSSGEEMARSTEFLFERNRLNVAVSRARAMAVLVYSPALLETATPSVDAMRLVNGLDRFLEMAMSEPDQRRAQTAYK